MRTLRYPLPNTFHQWYADYEAGNGFKDTFARKAKYSEKQKEKAIDYYIKYGENISKTVVTLGYPSKSVLKERIIENFQDQKIKKGLCLSKASVKYTNEQKYSAVKELLLCEKP